MRDLVETLFALPMPILLLMLAALFLWQWVRLRNALFVAATVLLTALSLPVVADKLSGPLAAGAVNGGEPAGIYAIVVPTAGAFVDASGTWWPSAESIRRAAAGLVLHRNSHADLIITGGSPLSGQPPEAAVVAHGMGLEDDAVRLETDARNTRETAVAVARMLAGEGTRRVVLVTSPVHFARMAASLRHHGFEVLRSPASLRHDGRAGGWTDALPSAGGLALSRAALHEYAAIIAYLIRGDIDPGDL